jgi:hypothetical protein
MVITEAVSAHIYRKFVIASEAKHDIHGAELTREVRPHWGTHGGVVISQISRYCNGLARISHQDLGSRRRIRVQKRCSGAKNVAIATVCVKSKLSDTKTSLNRDRHA